MSLEIEFSEVKRLIQSSRNNAFRAINKELVLLNWRIGAFISTKLKSASWGDGVVQELANYLKTNDPALKGFDKRGLYRMVQFYDAYANEDFLKILTPQLKQIGIVTTVSAQLEDDENVIDTFVSTVLSQISWSNHLEILVACKSAEEKLFYLVMSKKELWSVRELRRQIKASIFERTMLGNQQLSKIQRYFPQDIKNVFKDTYVLEFLNLPELHSEITLRKTLLKNLSSFMKELGNNFLFMGEEFKLSVGKQDFYIDLLFYHRELQCLVAFELKTDVFTPQSLAQINFYLEALDRDVRKPNENPSIGILLCKGKDDMVVEYALSRSLSSAMIADYQLKLPNKKLLQEKWAEWLALSAQNEDDS